MPEEKKVRSPEWQAHVDMLSTVQATVLLVALWKQAADESTFPDIAGTAWVWLSISNALWQAARVSEDLDLKEAQATLEDMAQLAEIRAEMEKTNGKGENQ